MTTPQQDQDGNGRLASTRWEWRRVKIARAPQAPGDRRPKGGRWRRFIPRDPSQWVTLRVKYTGGPEAWFLVDARGERNPIPGHTALVDLMRDVNQTS